MVNLRSQTAKNSYHQMLIRQMMILEKDFARRLAFIIKVQFRYAAHEVRQGNIHINSAIERYKWNMLKEFKNSYKRIGLVFSNRVNEEIIKGISFGETKDVTLSSPENQNFYNNLAFWINIHSAKKVQQVNDTTIRQIKRIIANKMAEDKTNSEIADDIEQIEEIASKSRAETIARTETHSVAVMAIDTTIRNSVIGDALDKKEWVTFEDERTRESHIEANGQEVDINDSFYVGGEYLEFPGDPGGRPDNIINCRCVTLYHTAQEREIEEAA